MVKKTKEVDVLLNRIAACLEHGVQPELRDVMQLEWLKLEYLEYGDRTKLASDLGLRYRARKMPRHEMPDSAEVLQDMINEAQYRVPPEPIRTIAAAILRSYTTGHCSATALFGERERKDRNGFSWQERDILGAFVEKLKSEPGISEFISERRCQIQDEYYDIYTLLAEISGSASEIPASLKSIRSMFETFLSEFPEHTSQQSPFYRPFSKDSWKDCHITYKSY